MRIFKEEEETKRITFNVRLDLAKRLEQAKEDVRDFDKKLDIESVINEALEKFLKKAEKKITELQATKKELQGMTFSVESEADNGDAPAAKDVNEAVKDAKQEPAVNTPKKPAAKGVAAKV